MKVRLGLDVAKNKAQVVVVRGLDGVGEQDGGEVASGWQADIPVEIVQHDHFKREKIRQWEVILDENIEL